MGSHIVARTSTTSLLPSAQAAGSQWGRTTWLQPMAPGIQSASSAQWASYLRPHTRLWLTHKPRNKWEKIPTHLLYLQHFDHKADENLMPDEYVAVDMMQINQGEPYFPVWVSFTFSSNLLSFFFMQHLVKNGSVCGSTSDSAMNSCYVLTYKWFLTENIMSINLNIALKTCHSKLHTVNTMEDQNQQLTLFDTEQSSSAGLW